MHGIRSGWRAACWLALLPLAAACEDAGPAKDAAAKRLVAVRERVRPLHRTLGKPGPNDWLARHREPGQTFEAYLACRPVVPQGRRNVLYIQPLGDFTVTQRRIIALTADFMGRYFTLPVKVLDDLPDSKVPAKARRRHPTWGMKQILSTYVLDEVLKPNLPEDAAACIAFTATDLWPGEGWNFVFGQASIRERVGVWSIFRNGDPDRDAASFRLCLLRTLKTATHETGHMFSMLHCIAFECNMCGSNHRAESDARPLALCPECLPKVCWATRSDPVDRFRKLIEFSKEQGLKEEEAFYRKSLTALGGDKPGD
jgi:archaemetzincin